MSYQYPPPLPPNGPEVDVSHPGYASGYSAPAPGPSQMVPRSHEQSLKERKESYAQANLSDPNQAALAGEKKRNKLGYHRTSVACGHCRRRKIRCIPSPADIQGRCINCIRLKKECSFFPVDQPPPPQATEGRPKPLSRASTGPNIPSASSSPAMASGQSPEMSQYQQYQHVAMPSAQHMAPPTMRPTSVDAFGNEAKMSSGASSATRAYDFQNQAIANWIPPNAASGSAAKPTNVSETWRSYPQESPMTPSFSPYTPQGPGSSGWGPAINSDPNAREDMGWASFVPTSMSFPSEAQLPSHYSAVTQGRSFGRKSSTMSMDMYPAQIATSVPGIDLHNTSLSAGAVPPSGYGSWDQPYTYSKTNEGYEGWDYDESRDH